MRRHGPRLAVLATALLLGSAAAQDGTLTGNVNGTVEQPVLQKICECIHSEEEALARVKQTPALERLPMADVEAVRASLLASQACLDAAADQAEAAFMNPARQRRTDENAAVVHLGRARDIDEVARTKVGFRNPVYDIAESFDRALQRKERAMLAMQGLDHSDLAARGNRFFRQRLNVPKDAFLDPMDRAAAFARVYGPPDRGGGSASSKKDPSPSPVPGAKKPPKDLYTAFRATKGTASNGFAVFNLGRDVTGPFRAQITAGVFTTKASARAALGNAFACFEFDVKGSSPLEFLSVCARPTDGGVQVFASSRTGNLGQAFLASTDLAVLDVEYDGTTFRCRAKKPGEADSALAQFATFTRPQGTDVWTVGIGGAGLGGKAEVGVDDFAIWAITR